MLLIANKGPEIRPFYELVAIPSIKGSVIKSQLEIMICSNCFTKQYRK